MVDAGFVDEVKGILADGYSPALKPLRSVGYAEMVAHIVDERSMDETIAAIIAATTSFAKRQRTWFRGERSAEWTSVDDLRSPEMLARIRAHLDHA